MSDTPKKRVLFHVQHLLGVGHIHRAKLLIGGLIAAGLHVDVVHGGEQVPGFDYGADSVTFLPPLRAQDSSFSQVLDKDGQPVTAAYRQRRIEVLLQVFGEKSPDCIIMEAWPFGRRVLRHELTALLDAARSRADPPLTITSVRDILQEGRKAGRSEEAVQMVRDHIDHVLVHSDPALVVFGETFPLAEDIAHRITYTGYVAPHPEPKAAKVEPFDTIVTAGGGAFGAELLELAAKAARHFPNESWCLSTGPNGTAFDVPENVALVERIDGLSAHMAAAELSISQCGYNTAMDVLASGVKAIFVPHDTTGQTEQPRRAALLAERGYCINLPQSRLSESALVEAIAEAKSLPKPTHRPDLSGISTTAKQIKDWLEQRP